MPLSPQLQAVRNMREFLAEEARQHRANLEASMLRYIETADAKECLLAVNALVSRVSSITGEAGDLEDAACVLIRHIENEGE